MRVSMGLKDALIIQRHLIWQVSGSLEADRSQLLMLLHYWNLGPVGLRVGSFLPCDVQVIEIELILTTFWLELELIGMLLLLFLIV